jgi:hypothetical protein
MQIAFTDLNFIWDLTCKLIRAYDMARLVDPSQGRAFHQLGVIATYMVRKRHNNDKATGFLSILSS